ncbi:SapC family protein [Sphingomonas sabuli]|uniref:SapC family protein n=1 Tax=Sphingomonas sabuli TaxID=2764186 RepID=A0A7G9L2K0_9SPHN|nr:SapC family protein [Sphingomonas sabuli]QNM82849.1 SapC family protein [Sphingomonas sabuli]
MATQAPAQPQLPLLYSALEPLSSGAHGKMKIRAIEKAPQAGSTHAFPATVDEFTLLSRHYPIIFAVGDQPVPLALMGLTEGTNVFLDENGLPTDSNLYIPAYLRRYPFLLARIRPDSDELSLCFDPSSGAVGDFEDGEALFDEDGQPSNATKAVLNFCEQFEAAGQRTTAFVEDLNKSGLLMDGEVAIQPEGADQPFIYRGFKMVDEEKLRDLRGDELRKFNQSGLLPLIFAHLFSLSQIRELFARQVQQGKGPAALRKAEPADA